MSFGFVIEPEKLVVLDSKRSEKIMLEDVPLGRIFIRDGWMFQTSRMRCEFGTLKQGDRFRFAENWYERASGKKNARKLRRNSHFGAVLTMTDVEFFENTVVEKLVVDERGAP